MKARPPTIRRRDFLHMAAFSAGALALSACARQPELVAETAQPTSTHLFTPTPQDTPTPILSVEDTPTPVPSASVVREAPELAAKVVAGELPPLEERLPKNPLTLKPVNQVGKYGGRLRCSNPWLLYGTWQSMYGHSPLRFVDDALGIAPGLCESWESNTDATVWTFKLREGLKWSDGQPVTTEDILFWWEGMVLDPGQWDPMPDFSKAGGKVAEFAALDDLTLEIRFAVPAPLTAVSLACRVNGIIGPIWIAPSHFFKPFHPKYNPEIKNYDEFGAKMWDIFRPVLDPWMLTDFVTDQYATFERNPYYYAVDTEGNQLPYIDGIDETYCPDRDTFLLHSAQGSVDFAVMTYSLSIADIPTLLMEEPAGNYKVRFWDSGTGIGQGFRWNYDCRDDNLRSLYRNPQFKRAISYALDRPSIHRIVFFNTGFITTGTTSPKALEFNYDAESQRRFQKWRDSYIEYNPEKAKAILDQIGMLDIDDDGWREMPGGAKYECRIFHFAESGMGDYGKVLEIAQKNLQEIGLNVILSPHGWGDDDAWFNGKDAFQFIGGGSDAPTLLLYPLDFINIDSDRWAPLCGNLFYYTGTEKENSELDVSPWERHPPRYHKDDPDYKGTPVEKMHNLYRQAIVEVEQIKRIELVWQIIDIHINEGPFFIGTVANIPRIIIVGNDLENVPTREQLKLGGYCDPWIVPYPAITNPETYYLKS